jgi:Ca-activated chloride channel homolog
MVELLMQYAVPNRWIISLSVVVFVWLAEWLHFQRIRSVGFLLFGPRRNRLPVIKVTNWLTSLACGLICWGLLTILRESNSNWDPLSNSQSDRDLHHLVIGLDVSPSMRIADAGIRRQQRRSDRASEVLLKLLAQTNASRTRVSIIAFYSESLPVVIDTFDPAVVHNVLNDLPLEHAFRSGKTDLYGVIDKAAELSKRWGVDTSSLVICSDGDSLPARTIPKRPPAFRDVLILGVGDANRGTFIDDHVSKQDRRSLSQLSVQLQGKYFDANSTEIEQGLLQGETLLVHSGKRWGSRQWALASIALGGLWIACLPIILTWFVRTWNPRREPSRSLGRKEFAEAVS